MKKFKKYVKALMWPFIFLIGQFLIQYIFVSIFNNKQIYILQNKYPNLNHNEIMNKLNQLINTSNYKIELNNYITSNALLILLITIVAFLPLFIYIYKKNKEYNDKLSLNKIVIIMLLGISLSLIYNITVFNINNIIHITNSYQISTIPVYIQILSSGIIGPILEELVFRGILYNKLKKFNKPMKSIIITSIIFSLFHFNSIINLIYAFMMSFIFIYVNEKYKTIKSSILLHITANTTIILFMYILIKNIFILNMFVLIVCIIILITIYLKIIKNDVYKN